MLELIRSLPLDLEDVDIIGRRLEGQVLRWDVPYHVTDDGRNWYDEGFLRGCAALSIRHCFNDFDLRREHRDERVGRVGFTELDDGLMFRATVDGTEEGEAELVAIQTGLRRGVSIRYRPLTNEPLRGRSEDGTRWRSKISIRELSLTAVPQFGPDAQVVAVRSHPSAGRYQPPPDRDALLTPLGDLGV